MQLSRISSRLSAISLVLALGGIAVGVVGYFAPRTLGVGYRNIEDIVGGHMLLGTIALLCGLKFISWSISLGSGTSGGTLAPLFTFGGGLGALGGYALHELFPSVGIDLRIAALVGMAAMFAGASRALLASVVFAFETTRQAVGLLPLLGGCCAAYLIACVMAKHSIMTEKIARRGRPVPTDYAADYLSQVLVRDIGAKAVVTLSASQTIAEVRGWLARAGALLHHHGFPVLDGETLVGVVTQRELLAPSLPDETTLAVIVSRAPVVIGADATARDAADLMVREAVGRLPVLEGDRLVGIVTRSDLLEAHSDRLASEQQARRFRRIGLRGARA